RRGHRDPAAALHSHPGGDHARLVPHDRESPALAPEGKASRASPNFPEHEPAVATDLNVDFDVRLGEIHPDVRMGLTNCLSEIASEILTRERVCPDSSGPEGERLAGRQGT